MQLSGKLDAETLPEVLISMVIIMTVFTITIGIYTRIAVSGRSLTREQVSSEMERILKRIDQDTILPDNTLSIDSVNYQISISDYKDVPGFSVLKVSAAQGEVKIDSLRMIIRRMSARVVPINTQF